jgi:hypothetical protein
MEMGTVVEQQQETIDDVENTAKDVESDTDKACAFVLVSLSCDEL